MSSSSNRRVLGGAVVTFSGAAIGGVLLFVNEVLAARFLGLETYGLFALALTAAKIGEKIGAFGLHVSALHFIPIERERGDFEHVRGTALTALGIASAVGGVLACLLLLSASWLAEHWFEQPELGALIRVTAVAIPFLVAAEILGNLARAFGRPSGYVYTRNLAPQVTLGLLLLLALILGWPPEAAAWAFVGAAAVSSLVGILFAWRAADAAVFSVRARWRIGERVAYALPVLANSVLYVTLGWTDVLMLGVFATPAEVAVYRACAQTVIVFDMLSTAFNAASANAFAVHGHAGDDGKLRDTYSLALRWQILLSLIALTVVVTNATEILLMLGPDFVVGVAPLTLLAAAAALHCCFGTAGFLMVMTRRQHLETGNAAVGAVANVVFNLVLVPRYGALGAAIGTAASLLVLNLLRAVQIRRLLGTFGIERRMLLLPAIACALIWVLGLTLPQDGGAGILLVRVTLTAMIASLLIAGLGLSAGDRTLLADLLRRITKQPASNDAVDRPMDRPVDTKGEPPSSIQNSTGTSR